MKKVILKSLVLESYKCYSEKEVMFDPEYNIVSGKNGTGKSTLMDAYLDIVTGKMADGTAPTDIRPIGTGDSKDNSPDIVRKAVLNVDGQDVEVSKVTSAKWVKARGTTEAVFKGNETKYEIDGYAESSSSFAEKMADLIGPNDIVGYCSNAQPFISQLTKSTADARKTLEKLSGFSLAEFVAQNPQYQPIADLCKGHQVEDVLKKLRKSLSEQKKLCEAKNTQMRYEDQRKVESIDTEMLNAELSRLNAELATLESQEALLDADSKALDAKMGQIADKKRELTQIKVNAENEASKAFWAADGDATRAARDLETAGYGIADIEGRIERAKRQIASLKEERKSLGDKWKEVSATEFDEAEGRCAFCGAPLPPESVAEKKEAFEHAKAERLKTIEENGMAIAEQIKQLNAEIPEREAFLDTRRQELTALKQALAAAKAKVDSLRDVKVTMPHEFTVLSREIVALEAEVAGAADVSQKRREIRQKQTAILSRTGEIKGALRANEAALKAKEDAVARLKAEYRELAQKQADIECEIDMVQEFSRAKNQALADKVNPYMDGFSFEFLDWTIDGNPVETCRMVRDGVDYFNINTSDRKLMEAWLVRGFQKMNGLDLPIWIDEAECINEGRIPDLGTQTITLRVADDGFAVIEGR